MRALIGIGLVILPFVDHGSAQGGSEEGAPQCLISL